MLFIILTSLFLFTSTDDNQTVYSTEYLNDTKELIDVSEYSNNLSYDDFKDIDLDLLYNYQNKVEYGRTEFIKILEHDGYYYVIGKTTRLRDSMNNSSFDATIIKYDINKKIVKMVKLDGQNYDGFNSFIIEDDYLYAVGNTRSKNGDYKGLIMTENYMSAFVTKYDLDLNLIGIKSYIETLDSNFVEIKESDGKFYCLSNSAKEKESYLVIYDRNLTYLGKYQVSDDAKDFYAYDMELLDKIYLVGQSSNRIDNILKQSAFLKEFDYEGNLIKSKYYQSNQICSFYNIEYINEKFLLLGATGLYNINTFSEEVNGLIGFYDSDNLVVKEGYNTKFRGAYYLDDSYVIYGGTVGKSTKKKEESYLPIMFYFNEQFQVLKHYCLSSEGGGEFLSSTNNDKETLLIYNSFYDYNDGEYISANILSDKKIVLTEEKFRYQGNDLIYQKEYYGDKYNENRFGKYYTKDVFINDYFKFYKSFNTNYVNLITNVEDKTYLEPVIVRSNSIMYLDNTMIENDTLIEKEGIYQIVFYGSNDLKKVITFEIMYPEIIKETEIVKNQTVDVEDKVIANEKVIEEESNTIDFEIKSIDKEKNEVETRNYEENKYEKKDLIETNLDSKIVFKKSKIPENIYFIIIGGLIILIIIFLKSLG